MGVEMSNLFKTEYTNIPLSIPLPWREFFDQKAETLGISRNAAFCIALKFGGPMLDHMIGQGKAMLIAACGNPRGNCQPEKTSEILASPSVSQIAVEAGNERKIERAANRKHSRARGK